MDSATAPAGPADGSALHLRVRDGLTIAVPPTLSAITTYVLLEQEGWFERESDFLRAFLRAGMTAIDIGANMGVYSLLIARLVGPAGRVVAYEPGAEARAFLEQSRALNALDNLEIVGAALSDGDREGRLAFAASSELRALSATGGGETVRITSLDAEAAVRRWAPPDLVKIDAEGEEERIIAGGRALFSDHSPLVMFEIRAGDTTNRRLLTLFPVFGYRLYRQLAGAPILVPLDPDYPLDNFELNLFAAKLDRAAALSQAGLLVDAVPDWAPSDGDRARGLAQWRDLGFAASTAAFAAGDDEIDPAYRDGLAAYAAWRDAARPAAERCAALAFALRTFRAVCQGGCPAERASTLARAAWDWGARGEAVRVLQQLLRTLEAEGVRFAEPFWPASPRFDDVLPGADLRVWFDFAAVEQFERAANFSSKFADTSVLVEGLCGLPFATAELERRRVLMAASAGRLPTIPARLCAPAPDHLNAHIWRAGLVPGAVVAGR